MPEEITHLGHLTPDPKNVRRHTPRNVGAIVDALHEVGAGRSIVIDEEGTILAGNATIEAAGEAGIERVRVVETDGNEIIAVRRTGLSPEQKRKLALYDNRSAELAEWDYQSLAEQIRELEGDSPLSRNAWADYEIEPLMMAEWSPPTPEEMPTTDEGRGDKGAIVRFTADQFKTIRTVCDKVREESGDPSLLDGECLERICLGILEEE